MADDKNIHSLLGQPAVVQLVDKGMPSKSEADKKVCWSLFREIFVKSSFIMHPLEARRAEALPR